MTKREKKVAPKRTKKVLKGSTKVKETKLMYGSCGPLNHNETLVSDATPE